ncbi:uncharacterized protein LOC115217239 [Octopus sinensis]|uniref:Uncharacterized protein LOC115217239 n=1 Tax=Octopus sinensis TaxID=2607531 RepID=A0A6P7SY54_9MOLL|nr:uncharacterized protein LOC115217239 [Octopus sinensis]
MCILPSTYTGGPRYMHERTQDAMTYVRHYGRPDLFITFTCNPKWVEVTRELLPGQQYCHRHDIIARVFRQKLAKLILLIKKGQVFEPVNCHMYTVEWQKRGLPHAHILLWLVNKIDPTVLDDLIAAEIPDPTVDRQLYDIVKVHMVHGPCGPGFQKFSSCHKDHVCTKRYPKRFVDETQTGHDGYPLYRRRHPDNGGFTITLRGHQVDNRWVVPYCPFLMKTFNAHINVEFCHSVKSIKYICKYVNMGSDAAMFGLQKDNSMDEVSQYMAGRYISSGEAFWRIFGFPLHQRHPAIRQLAVHLKNGQRTYFTEQTAADLVANPKQTTLTGFFRLCQLDTFAKTLLHPQVPSYYVWSNNNWVRRKSGQDVEGHPGVKFNSCPGRVYTVTPNQHDCFHLRLLLHEVLGPQSFQDIRTVDGVLCDTFREACFRRRLLEDDSQWGDTMAGVSLKFPKKIRSLFAILLLWCDLANPASLWLTYKDDMSEDFLRHAQSLHPSMEVGYTDLIYNRALLEIEDTVLDMGEFPFLINNPNFGLVQGDYKM